MYRYTPGQRLDTTQTTLLAAGTRSATEEGKEERERKRPGARADVSLRRRGVVRVRGSHYTELNILRGQRVFIARGEQPTVLRWKQGWGARQPTQSEWTR